MELNLVSTTYSGKTRQTVAARIPFADDSCREEQLLNLYPQVTYQSIAGFGGTSAAKL